MTRRLVGLIVAVIVAGSASDASASILTVGPQPDGTGVTSQGWRLTPAGTQTDVGPGPLAIQASPDGSIVAVENAGFSQHSLMVLDPHTGNVLQRIAPADERPHPMGEELPSYYTGLAFSPDGKWAYASDATGSAVRRFQVAGNALTEVLPVFWLRAPGFNGVDAYTAGIAVSPDGKRLYAAGDLNHTVYALDATTGAILNTFNTGHLPYGIALNHAGTLAFVTNWGGHTVSVLDLTNGTTAKTIEVGMHPCAILLNPVRDEIYVANSDSDSISVIDAPAMKVTRIIDMRPFPGAQTGASPNGLATDPAGNVLFVANAGDNDVAVVRLASGSTPHDSVMGLIPTAWYPSGVTYDAHEGALYVANMKGLGVGPAPLNIYWPSLMHGTVSRIPLPTQSQLAHYTMQVAANDWFNPPAGCAQALSPIKHVIYVMKENRTYDEIFGDLARGNGDPSLALFGQKVTPNLHALVKQFTLFDNFYADGEVSADGWTWSNGAYANTYNQKNWPLDYNFYDRPYDFGGFGNNETAGMPGVKPGQSFLWDALLAAGVPYVNYGFFVDNPVDLQPAIPGLIGHTDMNYPGWDLTTPDQVRMDEWIKAFGGYVSQGSMPAAQFVYLPDDHTWDTVPAKRTPEAMIANNDLALGRLVGAVSHSSFWSDTAIFVVEDDAQDGFDHVDGHRTEALVISPYTQTGKVDSTLYSTVSMLRTMEQILGVGPMTQFDAAATPMCAAFTNQPSFAPYAVQPSQVSLTALNGPNAPLAAQSAAMDFSRPDIQNEEIANEAVWASVHGVVP